MSSGESSSEVYGNIKKLKEVWGDLMGEDKLGRARGYRIGVTKTQVAGYLTDLRDIRSTRTRFGLSDFSASSELVAMLQNQCTQIRQEITTLQSTFNNLYLSSNSSHDPNVWSNANKYTYESFTKPLH